MKVACIQLNSGENVKINIKQTIYFVKKAIKNNSDLIITPEATSLITDNKKDILLKIYTMSTDPLIKILKLLIKKNKIDFNWLFILKGKKQN